MTDGLEIPHRIDSAVVVLDIFVFESATHVIQSIDSRDVGEECIAETYAYENIMVSKGMEMEMVIGKFSLVYLFLPKEDT